MEIYFDGYCPESLIKGKHIEMRLNEDDFWESEATGLQISVYPPFATILRWRGKGKFRNTSDVASNSLVGLVLTEAKKEDGKEIFPDEEKIINDNFDLEWYLDEIYENKEAFEANKFNPNDPVFKEQTNCLNSIPKNHFQNLIELYDNLKIQDSGSNIKRNDTFREFHKMIYYLKLIFNFDWMAWHEGWKKINDKNSDYSDCTLLDTSMYLTAIFRADRFSDGAIEQNFRNGTLDKIFNNLR